MNSYLFHNSPIQPEKQKSAAQNRTKTTNCPNSVSYGAWKFFSPYGSCSACTIRNRFALFGFQSVSAIFAFDIMIIQYTLPKKQELYFPLRMRVPILMLIYIKELFLCLLKHFFTMSIIPIMSSFIMQTVHCAEFSLFSIIQTILECYT